MAKTSKSSNLGAFKHPKKGTKQAKTQMAKLRAMKGKKGGK